jgi:DNA-binding NtrC family response regulator
MPNVGEAVGSTVKPAAAEGSVELPSGSMREFLATLDRVARTELPVVIAGERGTGKEWAARRLHRCSPRARGPFVSVDCGAGEAPEVERRLYGFESISWSGVQVEPGAFDEASRGTLHCDDAGRLPATAILRIARVLEHRSFRRMGGGSEMEARARLVLTTTLEGPPSPGLPPTDPWQRISPITLLLPPLRERPEDIPAYVEAFLGDLRQCGLPVRRVSDEALGMLFASSWPGNVRALKNALEYAAIVSGGDTIEAGHLPAILLGASEML